MEYTYIVRKRTWLVGSEKRSPGDLIPEAIEWPDVRIYLENGWFEKLPVDDPEIQAILERQPAVVQPTPAAPSAPALELPGLYAMWEAVAAEGVRRKALADRFNNKRKQAA